MSNLINLSKHCHISSFFPSCTFVLRQAGQNVAKKAFLRNIAMAAVMAIFFVCKVTLL